MRVSRAGVNAQRGDGRRQPGQHVQVQVDQGKGVQLGQPAGARRPITAPPAPRATPIAGTSRIAWRSATAANLRLRAAPQCLDVGDRAAAGDVPPGLDRARTWPPCPFRRHVVAEHAAQVVADLDLQPGGDGGCLRRDVVLVIEHGGEQADRGGDHLIPQHVPLVPHRGEGGGQAQFVQQSVHLGAQPVRTILEGCRVLHRLGDVAWILRVEGAAEFRVTVDRLVDQLLQQGDVLGLGAEEPHLRHAMRGALQLQRLAQLAVPGGARPGVANRRHRLRHVGWYVGGEAGCECRRSSACHARGSGAEQLAAIDHDALPGDPGGGRRGEE